MSQHSTSRGIVAYRSIRSRQFDDQVQAMNEGYNSVLELAFDELTQVVLELKERVESLEEDVRLRGALEG